MSDSKEINTKIKGDNNTVNTGPHIYKSNSEVKMPYEDFQRRIELERNEAVDDYKKASGDEKLELSIKIEELERRLADAPKAFEELQKRNAELEELAKHGDNKAIEKKFQKAVDAFKENEFTKADKILIEIEETEKLDKKDFGSIAYARGAVAEADIRWQDAAKHFARAAQFDSCYRNLILAEKFAVETGDYDSGLSLGEEAKKAAVKEYGENTEEYATSLNSLGIVYYSKKQYKKAVLLHTESLKIRQNLLGKKHPKFASSLNNLGGIYYSQKQYKEATYLFKRALNIYKEVVGVKHSLTADTLNNLGGAYRELGEFKKAKPLLKRALNIRKEILGDNHPDIANSYNNLGGLYSQQGQDKKAEPFCRKALEITETTLGFDHPTTKLFRKLYKSLKKRLPNTENTTPQ